MLIKKGKIIRRKAFKRQQWYSLCQLHDTVNSDCPNCVRGSWKNVWGVVLLNFLFMISPKLWVLATNTRYIKKKMFLLERI